jgi:hypothetical protein
LAIDDSTVAGNSATSGGGGIFNGGSMNVSNSTISANSNSGHAPFYHGGGIDNASSLTLRNSILAGNTDVGGAPDLFGSLATSGYNLIGTTLGGSGYTDTDLLNVDPLLGPLQDNGGPTQTMALAAGSPALNAGDPGQLGVADQRGVIRSGGVNIGAYQASATAFVLSAPDTVTAGVPFELTVTAVDPFGQMAFGYTGTVIFASDDPAALLPDDYQFQPSDQGSATFSVTLNTSGPVHLTVTDTADGTVLGSWDLIVC